MRARLDWLKPLPERQNLPDYKERMSDCSHAWPPFFFLLRSARQQRPPSLSSAPQHILMPAQSPWNINDVSERWSLFVGMVVNISSYLRRGHQSQKGWLRFSDAYAIGPITICKISKRKDMSTLEHYYIVYIILCARHKSRKRDQQPADHEMGTVKGDQEIHQE